MTKPTQDRSRPVRVAIVDDDLRYAEALAELVNLSEHFEVVGVAHGVESGCDMLHRTGAEFALIDVRMAGGGGTKIVRELAGWVCCPLLVLISAQSSAAELGAYAVPFVPKDELEVTRLWEIWVENRC